MSPHSLRHNRLSYEPAEIILAFIYTTKVTVFIEIIEFITCFLTYGSKAEIYNFLQVSNTY